MNYSKLKGKIIEVYGSQKDFAAALKKDSATISQKLSGKIQWKREEIVDVCSVLNIPLEEVSEYFFSK